MITNTLEKVRNMIWASLAGVSPEEWEHQRSKDNLKNAVDGYLLRNPDWKPSPQPMPVANTKQKAKRIMKTLGAGAGGFTPHEIDPEMLRLAREKCRQVMEENPEKYARIITAATPPDRADSLLQCLIRLT